jgi:hypothetical protein
MWGGLGFKSEAKAARGDMAEDSPIRQLLKMARETAIS